MHPLIFTLPLLLLLSCGFFQDDSIDRAAPKSCPEGDALDTLPITHRLLDRLVDTLPELFMDSATYAVATLAIVMEHASLLDADTVQSMGCSGEKGAGVEQLRCAYRIDHLRYDGQHEDRDLGFMRQRGGAIGPTTHCPTVKRALAIALTHKDLWIRFRKNLKVVLLMFPQNTSWIGLGLIQHGICMSAMGASGACCGISSF